MGLFDFITGSKSPAAGIAKQPAATLLGFANNHGIHHRGQLAAYLRGCGSKVPAIYGDSADEKLGG